MKHFPDRKLLVVCLLLLFACSNPQPAASPSATEDFSAAQAALETYLAALNSKDFQTAARLYAGTPDDLRYMNPDLDPQDEAALLEAGCLVNGLQCLALRRVTSRVRVSENEVRFTVEFSTPDGSLFVRGPCCGASETEMPSQAIFGLTVRQEGGDFYVIDLPPLLP